MLDITSLPTQLRHPPPVENHLCILAIKCWIEWNQTILSTYIRHLPALSSTPAEHHLCVHVLICLISTYFINMCQIVLDTGDAASLPVL